MRHSQAILALDIGGSAVKYGIWQNETLTHQNSFPTPFTRKQFYTAIQELCETFADFSIGGIAVSCPGEPDETTGIIHGISYVPFLHIGEFQQEFAAQLHLPVTLQNDADSAALAEMTLGIGREYQNVLFAIIGSGVGLAVVKDGKILKDSAEKMDTFEKFLADKIKVMKNSKVSPVQLGRTVSLKNFKWPKTLEGKDVFELAKQGNTVALQEIERMYEALAELMIVLNEAYTPEMIGLGGGISNNSELLPKLNEQIRQQLTTSQNKFSLFKTFYKKSADVQMPKIKICHFKKDANLIGAVLHFQETYN
ncbi:ROK family protein [Erwinia sp. CPCC 100877]|nr:ROK family protein [Erwinia sp. CPCC 100877]